MRLDVEGEAAGVSGCDSAGTRTRPKGEARRRKSTRWVYGASEMVAGMQGGPGLWSGGRRQSIVRKDKPE